jgi:ABC-type transporter Mla MlaB component
MSHGVSELQITAGVMRLSGDYTHATVARHLALAEASEVEQVDLSGLGLVDSSMLGFLLVLKRRAVARQRPLDIVGWPVGLVELARLYGVRELF